VMSPFAPDAYLTRIAVKTGTVYLWFTRLKSDDTWNESTSLNSETEVHELSIQKLVYYGEQSLSRGHHSTKLQQNLYRRNDTDGRVGMFS